MIPCETSQNPNAWMSDDASERAWAARECTGCERLTQCLTGALERNEMFGVWGGRDLTRNTKGGRLQPAPEVCQRVGCAAPLTQKSSGPPRKFCSERCSALSRQKPITHGTQGGYRMHRRRGEDACDPCLQAQQLAKARSRERAA
jgi:WhiB family redox-sensing transcriptional regulator